ncbi:hypothetical protein Y032_0028g1664 [Ancylostoma ceylanicum]|uniref:Uncharacterized protein n=1 Tax=Ancylostoma ceylanicum TaxID=53326 RepID=A0A016UUE9_9BILA|nr:hypothetical protein Y032_0028g1664 [Ancylostoma ceylanicum]
MSTPFEQIILKISNNILISTEPRSNRIFCPLPEKGDGHTTTRCNRLPDTVAKSCQAKRLGLWKKCLKPSHAGEEDGGVRCAACGRSHNVILCSNRQCGPLFKRHHH